MTVFNVSSVAMLWLCCTAAWAQDQACEVRVSPPAFDFGLTDRGALLQQSAGANELSFGSRRVQVQVICEQASPLTLRFDAPGADAERYRFGIGTLRLKVMAVRVDGVATQKAVGESDVYCAPANAFCRCWRAASGWMSGSRLRGKSAMRPVGSRI